MRNLTPAFQQELENGNRQYICEVETDIEIGTSNETLTFTNAELWASGLSVTDDVSSSDSSFEALGSVCVGALRVVVSNIDEDYTDIVFEGATFVPYVGLEINGNVERIKLGTYKVEEVTYNGALISFYCLDNLSKFDKPVPANMVGTATLGTIVSAVCTQCGVILDTPTFPNYTYSVTIPTYESITYREVLSYCAAIAGCFVKCSANGHVVLDWFDVSALAEAQEEIENDTYDGDVAGVHNFESLASQNLGIEDVVITGIQITIKNPDENAEQDVLTYTYGTSDYVIKIEDNPFITTANVATIGAYLQSRLVGLTFRYGSISTLNSPAIEAGDVCVVKDRKGKYYSLLITNTEFTVGSYQNISSAADTPARNLANRFSSSTKSFVEAKQMVKQEADARDTLEQDLTQAINAKSGMYETREPVGTSGAYIYYLHDKPNLSESSAVMKITNEAVAVTPNYQATPVQWYGLTVDGNFIANIMSVIGIDFDWGTGGTLTLGGQNNQNGILTVLDASANMIGSWDNNGVTIYNNDGYVIGRFAEVSQFGASNTAHIKLKRNAFQLFDCGDNEYFRLYTANNPDGTLTYEFRGNGSNTSFYFSPPTSTDATASDVIVTINGRILSTSEYSLAGRRFIYLSTAPEDGAEITLTYRPYVNVSQCCSLVFGSSASDPVYGMFQTILGDNLYSAGAYSLAIGSYNENLFESKPNTAMTSVPFVIGNGSASSGRSNAFIVDWYGNAALAGNLYFFNPDSTPNIDALNDFAIRTNQAVTSGAKTFTFGTDGSFTAPGDITSTNGTRSITLQIDSDGAKAGLWDDNKGNYLMYGSTGDTWIYLNRGDIYSSGIYCGTKILRTDGKVRVGTGNVPFTDIYPNYTVVCAPSTSFAWVECRSGANNSIFIQSRTGGEAELSSKGENGTTYPILRRANNAHNITAYGSWGFENSQWIYFNNASGTRKGMLYMSSSNQFFCGYAGYAESFGASYFDGNEVHVRSKGLIYLEALINSTKTYNSTAANAPNMFISSAGTFARSTSSSKRYKHDIKTLTDYNKILDIPVVSFKYNTDYLGKEDRRYDTDIPGFIAEDVYEAYPIAADFNEDGKVEDWNVRMIVPPMLAVIKDLKKQVQELSAEIEALKKKLN